MKKLLLLISLLFVGIAALAKDVKISVTPSDARIYVDGNYVGDGVITATIKAKEGFIAVKCEKEGYMTLETKLSYSANRTAVSYTLRPDAFLNVTIASGLVNRYFTITVDKSLYSEDESGKRDSSLAWKMLHQVILNYFDELQTTDIASGFIQTPWRYKTFPEAEKQMRSRVSVKESNLGGDLTFQVKITSEVAQMNAPQRDESFQAIDRIEKDLEPMIGEFQARVGKL